MDAFNVIAGLASLAGAAFAGMAWWKSNQVEKIIQDERDRQSKRMKIVLNYGNKTLELPVQLRRAEFTRAEILGRIGMIPVKETGKRFSIKFLNNTNFFEQLDLISEGDGEGILTIPCSAEEFNQFDLKD